MPGHTQLHHQQVAHCWSVMQITGHEQASRAGRPCLWDHRKQGGDLYYLNGYKKIHATDNIPFATICGIVSWVSDSVLEMVLEDSRAVSQVHQWQEAAESEIKIIESWGTSEWQAFVSRGLCGNMTANAFQDAVKKGVYVSYAFMKAGVFVPATSLPWSLAQGDIDTHT